MQNIFIQYRNLYNKAQDALISFEHLKEDDLRRKFFDILRTQILMCYFNLQVNEELHDNHESDFKKIFKNDSSVVDLYHSYLLQNLDEIIVDTTLFQSELVFRSYYSVLMNTDPSDERNLHKIISTIFEDTQNNWQKEECKLLILFWTLRNTIHTAGIYFSNRNGIIHRYKNDDYSFEYGKHPKFLEDGFVINLLFELIEALRVLLSSDKINNVGYIEHPAYYAIT